jgi:hypothetical protein
MLVFRFRANDLTHLAACDRTPLLDKVFTNLLLTLITLPLHVTYMRLELSRCNPLVRVTACTIPLLQLNPLPLG